MDKNNKRSVGFINYKRGLQTGISTVSSKNRSKNNFCSCKRFRNFTFRSKRTYGKKRCRICSAGGHFKRFLQHIFPSSEKNRGHETRNKFKTPQQVSPKTTLQNGLSVNSFECSKTRGLGNISRSKGRIYAYPCISKTQTVSEVLCKKQPLLTIFSSTVWSNISSSSFYQSSIGSSCTFTSTRHQTSSIPGRLVSSKSIISHVSPGSRDSVESSGKVGFHNQSKKILFNSNTENNIYRCIIPSGFRNSNANTRKSVEITKKQSKK